MMDDDDRPYDVATADQLEAEAMAEFAIQRRALHAWLTAEGASPAVHARADEVLDAMAERGRASFDALRVKLGDITPS